ncbi:alpha/beta fold hydrolase [Geodermatophilus sabuli]|uniref:Pimeloyl-ACP methyl ester carboxylesterase n=1 Tax=Geodermatophilus sabuli TaxID=1564158 RepID=A0A285E9D5_9ACTN|nr:alpha/beta hydrolase [Geodermatophilus sabuli]MBB3082424.1 pimeloyl-ACP methyl ester carboxylesterase [Geodermatophilus sabuli]SNX94706.1 Pimeloyl-ACP methyl ester carboxylesterase [Geodermatophilus sabuli]
MTTLEIPNIGTFDVELWEEGSGAPLLYLHGYERHPGAAGFLKRLAESRRVLAPELPGYGRSTGFQNFTDVIDVALYHRELVESLGVGQVDVVGHSLGGMFAAELAAIAPQLVRRLVLVNAFGVWLDDEPALDPFGAAAEVKAAKWHGEAPKQEPTNFVPDPDDPHGAILFSAQNLGTATKFMWPIADRGLRRRLPLIDAPTLVVHGTSDGLLPVSYADEFVRLVPNAELALIDAAGHYPMVEQEDEFVSVVGKFLDA